MPRKFDPDVFLAQMSAGLQIFFQKISMLNINTYICVF